MTAEKEIKKLFNAELVAENRVNNVVFHLYSNRIFHVSVPQLEKIGIDIIQAGYKFLDEQGGGQFHNIYQFSSFADIEPEIRDWAADPEGNQYTITDAIVIDSMSQKIIADFYMKFNRPVKPTKIFYSLEKAIEWTIDQIND